MVNFHNKLKLRILLRLLLYLIALTLFLPELRINFQGFFYPSPSIISSGKIGSPYFFEIIIILFFLVGLFSLILTKRYQNRKIVKYPIILLFLSIIIIPFSRLIGLEPGPAEFGQIRMVVGSLLMFIILISFSFEDDIKNILLIIIFASLCHSIVIIISYIAPHVLPFHVNIIYSYPFNRYAGLFSQPSRTAILLLIGLVLSVNNLFFGSKKWLLLIIIFSIPIISIAMILTQTRAAIITAVITVMLIFSKESNRKRSFIFILLVVILLSFIMSSELTEIALSRFINSNSSNIQNSLFSKIIISINENFGRARGDIWVKSIKIIFKYPFGSGFDTLNFITNGTIPHAHNMILQWGVILGIPGLYIFLNLIIQAFKKIWRKSKINLIYSSVLFGLVAYLIDINFEPFLLTTSAYLFWLLLGLGITPSNQIIKKPNFDNFLK